ncbi:MAG: hypothetical protein ABIO80_09200 [Sphingomicrobium sp.]
MTLMLKDPDAVLDYTIDWGAEYLGNDLLAQSQWLPVPDEPGGIAVVGSDFDATTATVKVGGGLTGHVYRLINRVELASGRIDDRSITLRVEAR